MKTTTLYLLRIINYPIRKVKVTGPTIIAGLLMILININDVQAQNWLKANGNLYTLPTAKVGIGTSTPTRNLEINSTTDNFLRVNSTGGNELDAQSAGIELRRILWNGSNSLWALNNESIFKIRYNGDQIFSLGPTIAWLGKTNDEPIEFAIYGKPVSGNISPVVISNFKQTNDPVGPSGCGSDRGRRRWSQDEKLDSSRICCRRIHRFRAGAAYC